VKVLIFTFQRIPIWSFRRDRGNSTIWFRGTGPG